MIQLKNISKKYIPKAGKEVEALKDINLEIDNSGMVFILGKSGSGKSTLLNLLGGLDRATSGDILIDGKSMACFKQKDFDNFRNEYVGFIFQEFNLLADFNVRENILLALQLSKGGKAEEKVNRAIEQVGLTVDYLSRKIDELSGGEKQRVAIARAIVKDSQMILADEPTGNLDSKTSESIWEILKNLSKEKLVVVVSHDRESAEKYADRILEISDGSVVSDIGEQISVKSREYSPKQHRLSNKVCLKMGARNLLHRKIRAISVILLSIFSILALLLTEICLTYSAEKTIAKFIRDNNVEYFLVDQGSESDGSFNRGASLFKQATIQYIAENATYIRDGQISGKQTVYDMGLSFIGEALELDENSYYTTTTALENAYESSSGYVMVDGEWKTFTKELHPIEYLIGKPVDLRVFSSADYVLAGVIDVTSLDDISQQAIPSFFALPEFGGHHYSAIGNYNFTSDKDFVLRYGESTYGNRLEIGYTSQVAGNGFEGKVLTSDGLKTTNEIKLKENEIILGYDLFKTLFQAQSKWHYVNPELTTVLNIPTQLGLSYDLIFYEYKSVALIAGFGEYKLVGIGFPPSDYEAEVYVLAVSDKANAAMGRALDTNSPILIRTKTINNLSRFLATLRKDYSGYVRNNGFSKPTAYAQYAYEFEDEITTFSQVFGIFCAIMTVVLVLVVINLISLSIMDRKKEIGILSALGTTSRDIAKIFTIETLVISVISFIVNLGALFAFTAFFNFEYSKIYAFVLPFFRVDVIAVATLAVACFGLLLLAAWIPIRKVARIKPIDAIRNN